VVVILDTNAVSAILAGDQDLADLLDERERHHLPVLVLGLRTNVRVFPHSAFPAILAIGETFLC